MFNREGYEDDDVIDNRGEELFEEIVKLRVGEAFLFAPSAMLGVVGSGNKAVVKRLRNRFVKIQVRERLTKDRGVSVITG